MIANYVDVNISVQAARMAVAGFNRVLFLFEDEALDRTKLVSTLDVDLVDLGGTETELYKAFTTYQMQPIMAPQAVIGTKKTGDATWADAIAAIREEDDTWYGCVLVSKVKEDILSVAAVMETLEKAFFGVTADAEVPAKTASNVAEELSDAGYFNTNIIYSSDADKWANAALAAYLSYEVGSITYNYKELRGVKGEKLTAAQRQNLIDQNCQVQRTVSGIKQTVDSGMTASGEWIDIVVGTHWLTARISEGIFGGVLSVQPKLPYTDGGGAALGVEVTRNLSVAAGEPHNFIRDDYEVFVPAADSQSPSDRAGRHYPGITFVAYPQGAVHTTAIRGTLVI